MKMLTLCVLGCVMMVLTGHAKPLVENDQSVRSELVKSSLSCSSGWSEINGRCFHYVPKTMTWAKAEKNCQSMGANLASVHNFQEYHDIQKLIATTTHEYKETWIGGSDAQQENVWLWTDGRPFHYTHWCRGEPNDSGKQHCIQMNFGDQKCWDDVGCDYYRPSVCAKKV
ncbi:ladderlectin-like [Anabas testudineus]|uniref:C-type lectin domain-containing protein n=1 Tax=Anabas testudineus TaxID=64144 RepID=A0A3Q1IDP6_ANATE|nr:ladderlectin-like [Anabas testudineus]